MQESTSTIDNLWAHPFDTLKDAKAISEYVPQLFDGITKMDTAIAQFETPNVVEDIIKFAVTYYLREIGARCYSSNSHLPAILSMADLSERFVPALFEHNMEKLYSPHSSLAGDDSPSAFSIHLASLMIQVDQQRDDQRSYLEEIGRAFGTKKRAFPMEITDRVFTPSDAEIDAIFTHAASDHTPLDYYSPIGSSLLLFSIAQAFTVVPGLHSAMKSYYTERRTRSGFRRPLGSLLG
ncbi:MAG: hypothetical protein ACTSUE_16420, partial [Promethearchaeota archaeon]